ncbi:phosphatidylglycerophosphatase A [Gilvimarinus agarilyticus]|uniref:phosphatidylglycerophosphatase A family protein n=1 Tax=unclassified Gilvimarinus TaxID=2642066 RepID=UPI001C088186|nr:MULTISPECIES: phosphatidylglycerophosphatase A [unclassified Gilvimarinus]MBU2885769.1 phosphatidylglycerophosphatase A [Gilvimarinus agarilyticus]MDO6570622.1 phosphatidylglycerophosphatase A [Gilvimarinus sp. 2_MG-2023]MDO6746197.1 phosphatidylglycerophosphatase A [Gilvimarinus sp. 1_MG-2023]
MTNSLPKPSWRQLYTNPNHFFAFGFGAGMAPKAPGTFGTLAAIPLYWLISDLPLALYIAVIIVGFAVGVYWCDRSSRALGVHDHPGIVWDEIIGYWITMLWAPAGWGWIVLGFVLFRLFDIAKPWPVSFADKKVSGGLGIMIDDVLAALYALLAMQLCVWGWAYFA